MKLTLIPARCQQGDSPQSPVALSLTHHCGVGLGNGEYHGQHDEAIIPAHVSSDEVATVQAEQNEDECNTRCCNGYAYRKWLKSRVSHVDSHGTGNDPRLGEVKGKTAPVPIEKDKTWEISVTSEPQSLERRRNRDGIAVY